MKTINVILVGYGACLLIGLSLFVAGLVMERPGLWRIAAWFGVASLVIGSLPLLSLAVVSLVEKMRRRP